jgi:hypothetical protein
VIPQDAYARSLSRLLCLRKEWRDEQEEGKERSGYRV